MTFREAKDSRIIGKDGKAKAPEHYRNAVKTEYSNTLRHPIVEPSKTTKPKSDTIKSDIIFLNKDVLNIINERIKNHAKIDKRVFYVNRPVPQEAIKNLDYLVECAQKYYIKTKDIQLTAAYYLKNIIVLQSFEDANHRTAIIATGMFLEENNHKTYSINEIDTKCFLIFKERLIWYRQIEYHTIESPVNNYVLSLDDVETTENQVFNYCLSFIKNKLLK